MTNEEGVPEMGGKMRRSSSGRQDEKRPVLSFKVQGLVASTLLALILLGAAAAAAQTLDDAVEAFKRGDPAAAIETLRVLVEQGSAEAQFSLGVMYAEGRGVPQDDGKAVQWFRPAADQGHAEAQVWLGHMYEEGRGVPQDDGEAVRWFRLAAEQGNAEARVWLGHMYEEGRGVPQDDGEAVRWFRLAAEQGNAEARVWLGHMYEEGRGVPQDDGEAVRWYRLAADQGDADAQYNLGYMYAKGRGVPQDDGEAVRWVRLAAEQGEARAQFSLGFMYEEGRGVPQDDGEAVRWYWLAAEQGEARAQFSLGSMYAEGRGVPQDDGEAVRWYRLAAEQGDAEARVWLGHMYEEGRGVPQDDGEAVRWYRLAAEQGEARAQVWLGYMYTEGRGVPQDDVQAHKWFNLAASRLSSSDQRRDLVVEARKKVERKMTRPQLAEAQRLAREWRPGQSAAPAPEVHGKRRPPAHDRVEIASTGSGFFVSREGHVLTNAHVIHECAEVRIPPAGSVRVAGRDDASDLALLRGPVDRGEAFAMFRQGRGIRQGADVVVLGFPLRDVLASEVHVTKGNVSALAGPDDDRRLFQMTAPVQPGNSGGPVLDTAGHVVGVAVFKLDAFKTLLATGDIPQNVNFAVSAGTARAFLDAEGVPYETALSSKTLAPDAVAANAKAFTVLVECWK